ncbi:MAG TPA: chloride channel protein, partial [Phycisphaeraceae bacterium]|nr:chloride channel protein [Phycisphaeraceae bacterium]
MLSGTQLKLRRFLSRLGFHSEWYLILLAAIIGSLTAGGSIGFNWLIRIAEKQSEIALQHSSIWLLPLIPMAGALVCGFLVHYFASEAKGHGVPEVLYAIIKQGGRVRPRVALIKALASAFTIGSGGSAGTEGPIAQIGAAIGSTFGIVLNVSREHQSTLLGCGVAAGLSSIFNAPIAGIFFVLEILLRDFRVRTFTPIVIASVISTGITQAYGQAHGPIFAVPPELQQGEVFNIIEMPNYALLGIICAFVAVGFTWMLYKTEDIFDDWKIHPVIKPVIGAAALGILGLGAIAVAKQSGREMDYPPFFGN